MRRAALWALFAGLVVVWAAAPMEAQTEVSGAFDVEAATEEYLSRMSPEDKARSDAYFEGGYWLQLWGFLYTLGVAWLLLGTGLSARLRDWVERLTKRRPLQTAIYAAVYLAATTVLFFPLNVYQQFFREHRYDLATQTFPEWMRDVAMDLGLSVLLLPLLFIPLYGVFRKAPRTWWLWGSVVGLGFLAFLMMIGPAFIDPMFNTYVPLEDPEVKDSILAMARENGIEVEHVYQFDASKQSNRVSANVSGFMGTMAIRLNDNLLNRCSLAEIKEVMAHEIGHYVLNHIYEMLITLGSSWWSASASSGGHSIEWSASGVAAGGSVVSATWLACPC